MAKALNRVTLIGNLGADPELRSTSAGASVATLSVATTESYKDKNGEWQEQTEWHRVVLWNRLADVAGEYLKKGNKVYVEGRLRTRSYDDKDGITRYSTEVNGSNLILLTPKEGSSGGDYQGGSTNYSNKSSDSLVKDNSIIEEDDVPF